MFRATFIALSIVAAAMLSTKTSTTSIYDPQGFQDVRRYEALSGREGEVRTPGGNGDNGWLSSRSLGGISEPPTTVVERQLIEDMEAAMREFEKQVASNPDLQVAQGQARYGDSAAIQDLIDQARETGQPVDVIVG